MMAHNGLPQQPTLLNLIITLLPTSLYMTIWVKNKEQSQLQFPTL